MSYGKRKQNKGRFIKIKLQNTSDKEAASVDKDRNTLKKRHTQKKKTKINQSIIHKSPFTHQPNKKHTKIKYTL